MATSLTTTSKVTYRKTVYVRQGSYGAPGRPAFDEIPINTDGTYSYTAPWEDRRETTKDPDWKYKVSTKQNASNNYFVRRINVTPGVAKLTCELVVGWPWDWRYGYDRRTWTGDFPNTASTFIGEVQDAALADIALSRLKRKLNNRTQSYNVLVPLGELRELRQTIEGAAIFTFKTVEALRDVKKLRLKDAYKKASDLWLSFSFGISPMMGTILDINKSIGAYLTRYDSIDRLTGSASREWVTPYSDAFHTTCIGANLSNKGELRHKLSYKYIAGHKFSLTSANDYSALDHFGIRPPSLVPVLWELTAFSWVVDYFTTAGAFLDDTFSGTTGNSIYVIKNRRYTVQGSAHSVFTKTYPDSNYRIWIAKSVPATVDAYEFRREALAALPGRILRFKTMDEMGLHAVNKLLNLTSVLSKSLR